MTMTKKAMLVILDGWGLSKDHSVSAIAQARTPYMDSLYDKWPHAELVTYGEEVGLPEGQMGNSEVGHLNIGAGRVVYQELARINKAIRSGSIQSNPTILKMIQTAKAGKGTIHLMGLLSDGGVHAHIDHLIAISNHLSASGLKVYIHAFLDGRDTGPRSAKEYVSQLLKAISETDAEISTVIGRYYAMDRDNRWERIAKAYQLLVQGKGTLTSNVLDTIDSYYKEGITDEFMEPIKVGAAKEGLLGPEDVVFFTNFRTDRPRQLTSVLTQKEEAGGLVPITCHFVTMTEYDAAFQGLSVVFTKDVIQETLGQVISDKGLNQLRIAETEKYPHVSFFFSGGREEPFPNESRIMVNSPKVATYDLQPEMSAYEVTDKVVAHMDDEAPELIILNYANADMVGHTGDMQAAIRAAEVLDSCMESLITRAIGQGYKIMIIADHGNSDTMMHKDGSPHTAHTTNMVPVIVIDPESKGMQEVRNGKLADVAPTLLGLMGLEIPEAMTGTNLCNRNK